MKADSPRPEVAVLVYGLVRSAEMLDRTLPSIRTFLAPISSSATVIANVECRFSRRGCVQVARKLRDASWLVSNLHQRVRRWRRWRDCTTQPSYQIHPSPARGTTAAVVHRRDKDNEASAMLALHEAMLFADRRATQSQVPFAWYVAARIDVVFLSPSLDATLARPWARPRTLFVPSYQHYCGLNDRFAFGHPLVMRAYVTSRLAMANETDICFQGAEFNTCLMAKAHEWIVAEVPTRFLRVRASLEVPAVDLATVSRAHLNVTSALSVTDEINKLRLNMNYHQKPTILHEERGRSTYWWRNHGLACQGAWLEWLEHDMGTACRRGSTCKRKEARRKKQNTTLIDCTSIIEKAEIAARIASWVRPCADFLSQAPARAPSSPAAPPVEDAHHGFHLIDMDRAKRASDVAATPRARGGPPLRRGAVREVGFTTCDTPYGGVPDLLMY